MTPGRRWALVLLAAFYLVGAVGHAVPAVLPWMLALTPWFLAVAGVAAFLPFAWGADVRSLALWLLPVFMVTFALEALGVATGWVFGSYHYTEALGALVLGVPPVIGWNWVLVVLGIAAAVRRWAPGLPAAVRVAITAVLCVAFDGVLEPVAIHLRYWVWEGGSVPFQNYLAWGLIAAAGAWWAERFPRLPASPFLGAYALLQVAFFAVLLALGVRA